jgi:hypothetical protein
MLQSARSGGRDLGIVELQIAAVRLTIAGTEIHITRGYA